MKTDEMSDEQFEGFIEVLIKGYYKPYDGLSRLMEKIQDLQLAQIEYENIYPLD